jgi:hypothetical protein
MATDGTLSRAVEATQVNPPCAGSGRKLGETCERGARLSSRPGVVDVECGMGKQYISKFLSSSPVDVGPWHFKFGHCSEFQNLAWAESHSDLRQAVICGQKVVDI